MKLLDVADSPQKLLQTCPFFSGDRSYLCRVLGLQLNTHEGNLFVSAERSEASEICDRDGRADFVSNAFTQECLETFVCHLLCYVSMQDQMQWVGRE